jgi:hypothetical protein
MDDCATCVVAIIMGYPYERVPQIALGLKQEGEAVEARRRIGMLGAERLLADVQRALIKRPRLCGRCSTVTSCRCTRPSAR